MYYLSSEKIPPTLSHPHPPPSPVTPVHPFSLMRDFFASRLVVAVFSPLSSTRTSCVLSLMSSLLGRNDDTEIRLT